MKPTIVAVDEMFPEGAGPYMEIEEVFVNAYTKCILCCIFYLLEKYSKFQS